MKKIEKWDLDKRIAFQSLLRQGYSLRQIFNMWMEVHGNSPTISTLSREVALGLTEEEYQNKQYVKYDIIKVYEKLIGADAVEYIRNRQKGER